MGREGRNDKCKAYYYWCHWFLSSVCDVEVVGELQGEVIRLKKA